MRNATSFRYPRRVPGDGEVPAGSYTMGSPRRRAAMPTNGSAG